MLVPLFTLVACAGELPEGAADIAVGEDALIRFPDAAYAHAVTLSYGEAGHTMAFAPEAQFSSAKFRGASGERVRIWVSSSQVHSVIYLVKDQRVVASSPASNQPTGGIDFRLATGGEYFIMFRSERRDAATFVVSVNTQANLDALQGGGGLPPLGAALTGEQLVRATPSGEAPYRKWFAEELRQLRVRECTSPAACVEQTVPLQVVDANSPSRAANGAEPYGARLEIESVVDDAGRLYSGISKFGRPGQPSLDAFAFDKSGVAMGTFNVKDPASNRVFALRLQAQLGASELRVSVAHREDLAAGRYVERYREWAVPLANALKPASRTVESLSAPPSLFPFMSETVLSDEDVLSRFRVGGTVLKLRAQAAEDAEAQQWSSVQSCNVHTGCSNWAAREATPTTATVRAVRNGIDSYALELGGASMEVLDGVAEGLVVRASSDYAALEGSADVLDIGAMGVTEEALATVRPAHLKGVRTQTIRVSSSKLPPSWRKVPTATVNYEAYLTARLPVRWPAQ